MQNRTYISDIPFELESGISLPFLKLQYATAGKLNQKGDNVIWICHALTANADFESWWSGMAGPGKPFDTNKFFIVCANMPGSCYGSISPYSENPETGAPWMLDFPELSNRDIVKAFIKLRKYLDIEHIHTLTGGSMGGQQALEWAITEPDCIKRFIPIATNAFHSPWGIAFNEAQRMAIEADATFFSKEPGSGKDGLKAARAVALLSYRNYDVYYNTQLIRNDITQNIPPAVSYQRYQGEKLINRFNAHSYWYLSKAMDSHDVSRSRESLQSALHKIEADTLIIGINSDILFPIREQKLLETHIERSNLVTIDSTYGHDGFLLESEKLTTAITNHFKNTY